MKKIILLTLFLCMKFSLMVLGQRQLFKVQYDQTNQGADHQNYNLYLYENFSHFILDFDNELFLTESDNFKNVRSKNSKKFKFYLIKDYKNKFLIKPTSVGIVKDSLKLIKWNIGKGDKNVLGYACKKASCQFRGRNYIAYYTPKIAIPDGPYKFCGLPGLILEIYSEDNFIRLEAKLIQRGDGSKIELPKEMYNKHIDFKEYIKNRTEQLEEFAKKREARLPIEKQGLKFSVKIEELEKF